MHTPNQSPTHIERLARKRVAARMGWMVHATVYVVVNAFLIFTAMASGRNWALYPALGWGLGLAIHGLVVFLAPARERLREQMVEAEKQRIEEQQRRG